MPQDQPQQWPLPPSIAVQVTYQLCMTIVDIVRDEAAGETSHRSYLKLCRMEGGNE